MYTLLARIEAILNSRPIIPISTDPNDLQALTPSHFSISENRLNRWRRVEKPRQHFWQCWSKEYLTQHFTQVNTRKTATSQVRVGGLVVLVKENPPPQQWKMGRIVETVPQNVQYGALRCYPYCSILFDILYIYLFHCKPFLKAVNVCAQLH